MTRQSLETEAEKILDDWASAVMLYQHNLDSAKPDGITPDYLGRHFDEAKTALLKTVDREIDGSIKSGFYAGQAMAGVELEDCHANWRKWNSNDE